MRVVLWTAAIALFGAGPAPGQEPGEATVRERVEVREVAVLADLPGALRSRPPAAAATEILVLEDGTAREVASLQPVAGAGEAAFGTVHIAVDGARCHPEIVQRAALALGGAAAELVALGPVSLAAEPRDDPFALAPPTGDGAELARRLARRARAGCPRDAAPGTPGAAACGTPPCLLVWVSAPWGSGPALADALAGVEPAARALAASGWTVLALAPVEAPARTGHGRAPETLPGDDRSSWTVDLLAAGEERDAPRSPDDYRRDVELGLAPLRRVVAATVGEMVTRGDRLPSALGSLRGRTLLFYRTDRAPGGPPVRLEVREAKEGGSRLRVAEWAPPLRP